MPKLISLLLAWGALFPPLAAHAAPPTILDFSTLPIGDFPGAEGVTVFTGPTPNAFGQIRIAAPPADVPDSPNAALVFVSNATPAANACPKLTYKIPGLGAGSTAKTVSCTVRFLIPITTDYRADFFCGGGWEKNAAVLMLRQGSVFLSIRALLNIASYRPNVWQELRIDYNRTDKTFSVFVNGKEKASDLPWTHATADDTLLISADALPAPQPDLPVLYLHKIEVSSQD